MSCRIILEADDGIIGVIKPRRLMYSGLRVILPICGIMWNQIKIKTMLELEKGDQGKSREVCTLAAAEPNSIRPMSVD
jgi:hypothetical protein